MITLLRLVACFLILDSAALAEIKISTQSVQVLTGLTSAELLKDSRILVGNESKPALQAAATVSVTHEGKFIRVKARKSFLEFADMQPIGDNRWLIVGSGRYLIEASSFDPDKGLEEKILELVIGGDTPTPPPKPIDPPSPIPEPDPVPDIDNEYRLGVVVLTNAPKDIPQAKNIAKFYRDGAAKLYGQGGLQDIAAIVATINTQFANKQCVDRVTCEAWSAWKVKVDAALTAEQKRRRVFTREDWYQALVEIANALEQLK